MRSGHDLPEPVRAEVAREALAVIEHPDFVAVFAEGSRAEVAVAGTVGGVTFAGQIDRLAVADDGILMVDRSEEPTSELQSLMRISYAVFCLKKKKLLTKKHKTNT